MEDLFNIAQRTLTNYNAPMHGYMAPMGGTFQGDTPERVSQRLHGFDVEFNNLKCELDQRDLVIVYLSERMEKQDKLIMEMRKQIDLLNTRVEYSPDGPDCNQTKENFSENLLLKFQPE